MQVESSASPLLTEDKASSLPGEFYPFHPRSTLELVEKAPGFCYVYCPEKMCFMFATASEWKEDIEWIAHHTHSHVKKYVAQLVCDCSNKIALRKSKQPWSQDRMFLTIGPFMRSLVRVRVSERQFRLPTTKKKTIWLASLLLEPQTPSKKCGILMLKENIGNLATCFRTLNGTIELSQKA